MANPADIELLKNFRETQELLIPSGDVEDFANQYLLALAQQTALQGNAITWEDLTPEPTARLYLTETNGELMVQLRFAYQEIVLDCESTPPVESLQRKPDSLTLVRIFRQAEKEKDFFDQLSGRRLRSQAGTFALQTGFIPAARSHAPG